MFFVHVKTVILLTLLTVVLLVIGDVLGGTSGLTIAFAFAMLINFFSYWYSDKIVLKLYRAKQVSKEDNLSLHALVEEVAEKANLPKPRIYLVNSRNPNAFATGRNEKHAAIAVTSGIMQLLSEEELKGVIAHELAHIKNRDTLISTIAAVIAGTISYIAFMARWAAIFGGFGGRGRDGGNLFELLALAIVAPIIALLVRMAISRSREFLADETGARFLGTGEGLAAGLYKLEQAGKHVPMVNANKGTSHMFIVNPFSARGVLGLFSTHPNPRDRIVKLKSLKFN